MTEATFWNGEPCEAERGTGVMVDSPQFPLFWGREKVGERVPVVKITYGDHTFYIYNDHNFGWLKVTEGRGLPNRMHADLDVEKYVPDEVG
jgi:hypothetical protein